MHCAAIMRRRKAELCVHTKLVTIEAGDDNDEVKAKRWKNIKIKLTLNLRAIASEFVTKNVMWGLVLWCVQSWKDVQKMLSDKRKFRESGPNTSPWQKPSFTVRTLMEKEKWHQPTLVRPGARKTLPPGPKPRGASTSSEANHDATANDAAANVTV